jgi:TIR domain
MARQPEVFISYNKLDREMAELVATMLTLEGIRVWFSGWEINYGDSIVEGINKALRSCTHVIFLWSINSSKSKWVEREVSSTLMRAINHGKPKVIPLLLDKQRPLPLLSDILYIRHSGDIDKTRCEIIKSIIDRTPEKNYYQAIEKAYKDILRRTEFNRLCSRCASPNLEPYEAIDYAQDESYSFVLCKDCEYLEE